MVTVNRSLGLRWLSRARNEEESVLPPGSAVVAGCESALLWPPGSAGLGFLVFFFLHSFKRNQSHLLFFFLKGA